MNAKPTLYNGVQFRSRLEATWAAFFDLWGEPWEYEPAIYDTPGWTPDFLLTRQNALVEVKPVEQYDSWSDHECIPYIRKRLREFGDRAVVLARVRPFTNFWTMTDGEVLCYMRLGATITLHLEEGNALLAPIIDLQSSARSCMWVDPQETLTARDGQMLFYGAEIAFDEWASAKNLTQWRPPNGA